MIGSGGERIRRIGTRARQEIERLLERRVYLELRVKVEPRWPDLRGRVEALGTFDVGLLIRVRCPG